MAREIEYEMDRGIFVSRAEAESTTLRELLERYREEITPLKNSAARTVPLSSTAVDVLRTLPRSIHGEVFPGLTTEAVKRAFARSGWRCCLVSLTQGRAALRCHSAVATDKIDPMPAV